MTLYQRCSNGSARINKMAARAKKRKKKSNEVSSFLNQWMDFSSPERGKVLTTKLLSRGYQKTKLVATLKKFYGRHHDLVNPYNVAVSRIISDVFASDAP